MEIPRRHIDEVRGILLERARLRRNPMEYVPMEHAEKVLDGLHTLDRDVWAKAFSQAAEPFWDAALNAEDAGRPDEACGHYLAAYGLFRVARYPAPNSQEKMVAYRRSQAAYLRAAAYFDPPVEVVHMAYRGVQAPGQEIAGYLRRPAAREPLPLIVQWGGIDSFKEDRKAEPYLDAGWAVLAVDMPGVGDAPIPGSAAAEELWDGIFDWAGTHPAIDANRVAVVGSSTGGYWATKLAHTHSGRIAAAVNHGGPAHFAFQSDWIVKAQGGEYPQTSGNRPDPCAKRVYKTARQSQAASK